MGRRVLPPITGVVMIMVRSYGPEISEISGVSGMSGGVSGCQQISVVGYNVVDDRVVYQFEG